MSRFIQVLKYGWKHAGEANQRCEKPSAMHRLSIFADILYCYRVYKMWSNQYLASGFDKLSGPERRRIGLEHRAAGLKRDAWQKDFRATRRFLTRYSSIRYEQARLRDKRRREYTRRFNAGRDLLVEYDVNISRQHYLDGTIKIGNNVLLAKHVFIDYTGNVVIEDDVQLTNGVIVETHSHPFHSDYREKRGTTVANDLLIRRGAVIGSRAIIMPGCHYIGLHARVGAGAVVTHDVPDYAVAVGVPAKVIRYQEHRL